MTTVASPRITAPLDPEFSPAALVSRRYAAGLGEDRVPLAIGLEREDGLISRYEMWVRPRADEETVRHVERTVKFLLWSRGGFRLYMGGPQAVCSQVAVRAFDIETMLRIYEKPFDKVVCDAAEVPPEKESGMTLGGHLEGCRIGFDLGASDFKVAAVRDGKVVYSEEFPWNPREQPDPEYHYTMINHGLKKAAACMPHVDAIGGSSAGVIIGNTVMLASLFRAVPESRYGEARDTFLRLSREWGVPLEVANDGDVTALAGAMSLGTTGVLGIAMGSSQAAGYIDRRGRITGWLNELAFAPIDYNSEAAADEWSGDRGAGALYFSQQAVNRLLPAAGIGLPATMPLPERLVEVQALMSRGDPRASAIYETLGVYLGYGVAHYADFYSFDHVLVLGRVTTGLGGEVCLSKAREVHAAEFPDLSKRITLSLPSEKSRRVGQAVVAASLPELER